MEIAPYINASFTPSAAPAGVDPADHLASGLYAYINADKDPELKKRADETFGRTVPFDNSETQATLIGRSFASRTGYRSEPLRYLRDNKLPIPPNWSGENAQLYTIIGQHFISQSQEHYNNQKAEQDRIIEQSAEIENAARQALTSSDPLLSINPALQQDLINTGGWDSFERAANALSTLGIAQAADGFEKNIISQERAQEAIDTLQGDEVARGLLIQAVSDIARKTADQSGFFPSLLETLAVAGNEAIEAIRDGSFQYQLAEIPGGGGAQEELNRRIQKAQRTFAENNTYLLQHNPDEYQNQLDLETKKVVDDFNQYIQRRKLTGEIKAAIDAGRIEADSSDMTGWLAETRRHLGTSLGNLIPFMVGGLPGIATKTATFASMGESSLEQVAIAHDAEQYGELDPALAITSSANQAQGGFVGMTLGAHLIKTPFKLIPSAVAVKAPGITAALAQGGIKGYALNYGIGTAVAAADLGLVIPTATAGITGALNIADNLPAPYANAYETYKEGFKRFADPHQALNFALESAMFGGFSVPGRKAHAAQTIRYNEAAFKSYKELGGTEEDWNAARQAHPIRADKRRKDLVDRLIKRQQEDPIGTFNRRQDALNIAVNEEQARSAMEDSAARAFLARNGILAEQAADNNIRIYTKVEVKEDGSISKGTEYYDVTPEVAQSYLGRIYSAKLNEHADMLRNIMAGRIAVKDYLKRFGSAGREEILPKAQTLEDLQKDAQRALRKKQELMAGDESKAEAVGKMIIPEISPELTLDAVINLPASFENRLAVEKESGGQGNATAAYVVPVNMGDGSTRYVLRHTHLADFIALSEELGEQSYLNYQRIKLAGGGKEATSFTDEAIARDLLDLREWLRSQESYKAVADTFLGLPASIEAKLRDRDILTPEEAATLNHAVVEAFSKLFRAGLVADAMQGKTDTLPNWAQSILAASAAASTKAAEFAQLGTALRDALAKADSPEGQRAYQDTVNKLWLNHQNTMRSLFEQYREPSEQDYLRNWQEWEKLRDEQDARVGRNTSQLPEITEERIRKAEQEQSEEIQKQQEEETRLQQAEKEATEDLRDKPGNAEKSTEELHQERIETYADAKEEQTAADPTSIQDESGTFSGGRFLLISSDGFGDVRAGMLPVEKITLSKDVPQFKRGADAETGVVNELTGLYRPDHDPIRVWQRSDGSLEVISGRHRLAYARQAGATRIMAYVYTESPERDARWARTFDLEQNIRDNQATELEIALYVRGENAHGRQLSDEEIQNAGISRKGTRGEHGVTLGRYAADEILEALRNDRVTVADAVRVVDYARPDRDIQREGLRVLIGEPDSEGNYTNGGSISEARRTMQRFLEVKHAMEENSWGGEQGELFGLGFGESIQDTEFNRFFGKYQTRRLKEISADRSYLNKLVGGKLSPAQAQKYGIDIKDPDGLQKRLQELSSLYEQWKNPSIHPELMEEITRAFKEENAGQEWLDLNASTQTRKPAAKSESPITDVHFSLGGEKAATFGEMQDSGLTYYDPADGKHKFCIDSRGVRLNTGFTMGQLTSIPEGGHKNTSLAALIHFPELWRAYPELAKMRVRLYRGKGNQDMGTLGYYDPYDKETGAHIALHVTTAELVSEGFERSIIDTLLHEAQHAIQHHEGWSRGAGDMDLGRARKYLAAAIMARKERGADDEWSQANLAFLNHLLHLVNKGDPTAIESVYWLSHGEQEARFAGASTTEIGVSEAGFNPMKSLARMPGVGVSSVAESWMTIPVPSSNTELGGLTFGNAGRYAKTMDSRLAPVGDFYTDQRLFQMREAIARHTRELFAAPDKESYSRIMLDCLETANTCVSMLPNEYRFGLEPYQTWFKVFAKLGESGNPDIAAAQLTMRGWERIMRQAFRSQMALLMQGSIRKSEMEFWAADEKAMQLLRKAEWHYREARDKAENEISQEHPNYTPAQFESAVARRTGEILNENPENAAVEKELYKRMGLVKAEKVMAKLLERVSLKLDQYRKDKTLGKIRRVVESLSPTPGKDGKPAKGKMDSLHYNKLHDYMQLLDMKKGELEAWMEEHYPEEKEIKWEDEPLDKKVAITLYDNHGKAETKEFTVAEINTFACYENMTASAAERMSLALGEFISTGRNAWENAQQAHRNIIQNWCSPLLKQTGILNAQAMADLRTEARKRPLDLNFLRSVFAPGMNDVQFFDTLSSVPSISTWAKDIKYRLGAADTQHDLDNRNIIQRISETIATAIGTTDKLAAADFISAAREVKDTDITLVEIAPDFLERESATYRRQLLGLIQRKVDAKNFNPHVFAPAIRNLLDRNKINEKTRAALRTGKRPDTISEAEWNTARFVVELEREILHKYGHLGSEFTEGNDQGNQVAYITLFSDSERARFENAADQVGARVSKALYKYRENHFKQQKKLKDTYGITDTGTTKLRISQAEAAYQVMLYQQADLRPMMEVKGYNENNIAQLEKFAGKKMMQIAYNLRDILNERTELIAERYEKLYGIPFPRVDNYFRAFFDVLQNLESATVLESHGNNATTGKGKEGILRTRSKSLNKELDYTIDIFAAFETAMKEQSVFLNYGEISRDLSAIINFRDGKLNMAKSLEATIGNRALAALRTWADAINWIVPQTEASTGFAMRLLHTIQGIAARSILPFRAGTNLKQWTSIFNTVSGSDLINYREWMASGTRLATGRTILSAKQMAQRPAIASRFRGWGAPIIETAIHTARGKATHHQSENINQNAAQALEWQDRAGNLASATILYDAVYRKLKKQNPTLTEQELDQAAIAEVETALASKSQPLNFRQKALDVTQNSIWKIGGLFLGSESINTMFKCISLAGKGGKSNWGKAAQLWLTHGILLQLMQSALDWAIDDEKRHNKRTFIGYLSGAIFGPISGVPFISQLFQGGIMGLEKITGTHIPVYVSSGLMPFADIERTTTQLRRDWKILTGNGDKYSWANKAVAFNDIIRTSAMFTAMAASFGTRKSAAITYGASLTAAAIGNALDFLLRLTRTLTTDRK